MKKFLLLLLMVFCLVISSCGGGGGGGGGGDTGNNNGTSGSGTSNTGKAPNGLPLDYWRFHKTSGDSNSFLVLYGSANPTGVLANNGGTDKSSFWNGAGFKATYTKTGVDTATLTCYAEQKEDIEQYCIVGYKPISNDPIYGWKVVGERVAATYSIDIKLKFKTSYTIGSEHRYTGDLQSFVYKVNGVTRYSITGGTFDNY